VGRASTGGEIMEQVEFGGVLYPTLRAAARAEAVDMLPDVLVLEVVKGDATQAARELESFLFHSLRQSGLPISPKGSNEEVWRQMNREEIAARIQELRDKTQK
jgi:hypothetical protein